MSFSNIAGVTENVEQIYTIKLRVNGTDHALGVRANERLIDLLRDRLGLKSVKEGCGTGDCGNCLVLYNGKMVNSCLMLAVQARNSDIITVEGLSGNGELHPLQKSFIECGAVQCGFCIPAMILAGKNLLDNNPNPSVDEIKKSISGVLCRCTGYYKIIEAIQHASRKARQI